MTAADGLPPLRDVIARHGLMARRALGQNFLCDLNLTARIARSAGRLDDCDVLEVGPGPGGLTRALLTHGARRIVAIERDARCLPALAEIAEHWPGRLEVVEGDAMALDHAALLRPHPAVVANLPYNIGTELLLGWLRAPFPYWWRSLTLMFQREVAARIVARPGDDHYGRLSVLVGWRTDARVMFDVAASNFTPPPKVTSSVVSIRPLDTPVAEADLIALETVTAAAFGQRRKMLRQSLKPLGVDPGLLLEAANVEPTARAETVDVPAFCAMARAYLTARRSNQGSAPFSAS